VFFVRLWLFEAGERKYYLMGNVKNPKLILAVAAFAAFIATFNETYLNVAFAPIMEDLGVDVSTVQWLATAYMLGAAVMVPVSAFAYRSIPTRPLFVVTVSLLVIGSVISALSGTFPLLLAGRIVQALGTGLLIPIGMNITLEVAPREKLGAYMGIMGAMTTLGPSSSVIVAGALLSRFDWHVMLWVFGGLSFLCLLLGAVLLRNIAKLTHPKLDALSVTLVGLGLIGILYGLSTVFSGNIIIAAAMAVFGAVCLGFFLSRQKKIAHPLIDLRPFSIRPFTIGVIINMISLIVIFAMNILIPVFMQEVLKIPPLTAALTLFPAILFSCVLSPIAGRIYDKHGAKVLLPLGFALIGVFTIAFSLLISGGSVILLAGLYIPVIGGSALIIGPVQSFSLSHLTRELHPHGITILSTGFQIAGCIGSSLFTGIYAGVIAYRAAAVGVNAASGTGFVVAGIALGVIAFIGIILAVRVTIHKVSIEANENRA
jgi:DHA2 family lincomycin resistance protein-like MFS transporter